jgi:hypothetical protein
MAKGSAVNRKRIAEIKAKMRRGRILQAQRNRKPDIPDKIMKQLGSLGLPPNPWVYDVILRELMRDAK